MTEHENAAISRLDGDMRALNDRMIVVETKIDDAQELREVTRGQLDSVSNRMGWLLALLIGSLVTMAGSIGGLTYAVTAMSEDIRINQQALETKVDRVIETQRNGG